MVAAGELPFDGPPLADEEEAAAAATGAVAGASFLDLLMDEDDVPQAAQLSQAQIIESQARTLAELTRKVEAGNEYKRLTKSKLKEAAARLREYRLRVEELTAALDKAKKQKPTAAAAKAAAAAAAVAPPRPPMRDAVTQTLPPVRRDMTTQTLQPIPPPVVHCATQTIEAAEKQDAVPEKKAVLVHAAVQTLSQAIELPPSIAHCGTQTLIATPTHDGKKAALVHADVQTLPQSIQLPIAHCGTQTLDVAPKQNENKAELVSSGIQVLPQATVTQMTDTTKEQEDLPEMRPEVVDSSSQAEQVIQLTGAHSDRQASDPAQIHDILKNPELVSSGVQMPPKPIQSDAAISNAIDAELELMSSDSDDEEEHGEGIHKGTPALVTEPVDAISAAIDDELASSSDDDMDMDIDQVAPTLETNLVAYVDVVSAVNGDELASHSKDDQDMNINNDTADTLPVQDTSALEKISAVDAVRAAIGNELASNSKDDRDMDIEQGSTGASIVKDALTSKQVFTAPVDAVSAAIDDELASSSGDDSEIDDDRAGTSSIGKDASTLKTKHADAVDAISAVIDDELASSSEDDQDMDLEKEKASASIAEDAPTMKKLPAAHVDAVSAAIDDALASSSEDDTDVDIDDTRTGATTDVVIPTLKKIPTAPVDAISAAIDVELASSSEDEADIDTGGNENNDSTGDKNVPLLKKIPVDSVDAVSAAIDGELANSSEDDIDMNLEKEKADAPAIKDDPPLKKIPTVSVDAVSAAIDDELASSSEDEADIDTDENGKDAPIDTDVPRIRANSVVSAINSISVRTQVTETEMRTTDLSKHDGIAAEMQSSGLKKKTPEHVHLSIQKVSSDLSKPKAPPSSVENATVQAKTKDLRFDTAVSSAIDDELDFGSSDSDESEEAENGSTSARPRQINPVHVDTISAAIEDELASSSDEKEQEPADELLVNNGSKNNHTATTQKDAANNNIPASRTDEEADAMASLFKPMRPGSARRFDTHALSSRSRPRQQASISAELGNTAKTNKATDLVEAAIDNELASSYSEDDEIEPTSSDRMMDHSDSASPRGAALRVESTSIWAQVVKPSMPPSRNTDPLGNLSDSTSDSSSDSSDDSSDSEAAHEEDDAGKAQLIPLNSKSASEKEDCFDKHTDTQDGPQDVVLDQDGSTEKPVSNARTEAVKASTQSREIVAPALRKRSISSASIVEEIVKRQKLLPDKATIPSSPTRNKKVVPEKPMVATPPVRPVEEAASPVKRQKVAPEKSKNGSPPRATTAAIPQATPGTDISAVQDAKFLAPQKPIPEPAQSMEEPTVDFAKSFQKLISRQEHEKGDDHYVVRTITALKKSSFKTKPDHVAKLCRVLADEYRNRHITPLVMVNGTLRAFLVMRKGYTLNLDEPSDLSDMCVQVLLRLMRTTNRLHDSMATEKQIALLECLLVLHQALWTSTGTTIALDSFTSSSKLSGATQVGFQHDPKATKHYVYLAYTCAFFSRLCTALDSSERVHVLAFDILKHSPTILGLFLVRTIMTVVPQFLRTTPLTFIQETLEHAMILVANRSADERELIGDESSMMILSSIASMISRGALSAAVEEDPGRAQKAFVNRIWMQEIDELVSCETTTASGSEYAQRSFELGKCMELLAVVYDLDGVTRSFSVERFQTVFNECEAANGFGKISLVQLAGSIASVVAAKLPDDASIAYVNSVGSWMQQLLRTPSENEPTYPQLQLACVSVCVDLVLALASAKSVVGIWWWSALHWAEQQPTETMWEFPAEFLRRFRLAVFATSEANEIKSEK